MQHTVAASPVYECRENPRHFVYEYEIYTKIYFPLLLFVYKYALTLTLTLTLTLNPNLSVKKSRHFVHEYDIYMFLLLLFRLRVRDIYKNYCFECKKSPNPTLTL